jgi:transmembrane sensor
MGKNRAEELIRKCLEGTTTQEEDALLESWYIAAVQDQPEIPGMPDYSRIEDEIWQPLRAEQQGLPKLDQPKAKSLISIWPLIAAAAAVILVVSVGSLFIPHKSPTPGIVQLQPLQKDILPAGMRATLTLFDGRTIAVDSANSPMLAIQGDRIISSLHGQLIYNANQSRRRRTPGSMAYNTLTTSPGEHYSLVLPDGTGVWLNAASSITYPVVFNARERKVKVTGEVYFEIVHNAKQPFRIMVKNELVEDIGTHLNINAYDDESTINTTLLEGSIKVSRGSASAILNPGQQATIRPNDDSFELKQVDCDKAIAWKSGYFYFERADIQTVMRQLARWYNVQVVYKGKLPKRTFRGKVYRNINASEALGILSYFGAHFYVEGNTITVSS